MDMKLTEEEKTAIESDADFSSNYYQSRAKDIIKHIDKIKNSR